MADTSSAVTEQVALAPVVSVDLLVAGLRDITAHLEAHVERRAAELAQPLITAAVGSAAKRVADAETQLGREKDLTTELRRQLRAALCELAGAQHKAGLPHDKSYCSYCKETGER